MSFPRTDKTTVKLPLPNGGVYFREITRAEYERWIRPIVDRTMAPVRQALADAKLTPAENREEVVLVGGSTRVPSRAAYGRRILWTHSARGAQPR